MNSIGQDDGLLLVTIEEAARRLGMSIRTIYREIAAGRFPRPLKIGRKSVRIPVSALLEYVERLKADAFQS